MSRIAVVGAGYVGLVTAACFAKLGHDVTCIEADAHRVMQLRQGRLPINEPGLSELWRDGVEMGRLRACSTYRCGLDGAEFLFLAVGTPPRSNGRPNLRYLASATRSIAHSLKRNVSPIIVIKSTVPVGASQLVGRIFAEQAGWPARVVSNPEFLREGNAVLDFLRPDRIVIGSDDPEALDLTAGLYRQLKRPVVRCSPRGAELIKYASNALLATKISFINEIAAICEKAGVDVVDVSRALALDPRMGMGYLDAGLGWGGSCLPKDLQALTWMADEAGVNTPLLRSVAFVNDRQPEMVVAKLAQCLGDLRSQTVALLGLTFKANCDDVRDSPALRLARLLLQRGVCVRAYDPLGMPAAAREIPAVEMAADPYSAAAGADAVVVATAWPSFTALDFAALRMAMAGSLLYDARNFLDGNAVTAAGLTYLSLGHLDRPASTAMAANGHRPVEGVLA